MGDNFELKEILQKYIKNINWFVFCFLLAVIASYIYLRYTHPKYNVETKIQIIGKDDISSGLNLFAEIEGLSEGDNMVEDEIEIINSRSNMIEVVEKLGLNTRIKVVGNITDSDIYKQTPINVSYVEGDSLVNKISYSFYITLTSETTFGFSDQENIPSKLYSFGKKIPTPIGNIVITPNLETVNSYKNKKLNVLLSPLSETAKKYNGKVNIAPASKFSNILQISIADEIKERGVDILNELVAIYNKNAIKDKKVIADRTSDFIDDRIADIASNLSSVDQSAEEFKTGRGVTDIANEANINLNVGAANRQELANVETQYNIASSMKDIIDQQQKFEVLPANLGLSDPTIANTTQKYNQLVQERDRLLKSSNAKNPVIVNLDQELSSLKKTMQASLNSTVNNLGLQVNTLSGQQAIINSKIYSAPKNERALRDITRRQQTTESLYLYLLQKREEAQIAVASTSPKCKIIDPAYPSSFPVSPNSRLVYLSAILIGLLVPFSIVYFNDLLDNKIHNMQGLTKLVKNIPVLGELPRLRMKDSKIIVKDDRSLLSEALRILRTNLDYLIKTKGIKDLNNKNNVVFITSSVSGEGKTFVSSNLSMILASTNKKVLLIGADIRNPKIYSFFTNDKKKSSPKNNSRSGRIGLTEYLYDRSVSVEEIISGIDVNDHHIDIIYSGRIPPNPAELLMSDRMRELIKSTSEFYDYVIVDTAPLMVVTDTLLISNYADHLIYVVRADMTENKAVQYPVQLQEEGKIKGLCFIVNNVKTPNLGYGGKYGYGYGVKKKSWWKLGG